MQFPIHEIAQDVVTLTVFEMCPFSPDGLLSTILSTLYLLLHFLHRIFGSCRDESNGLISRVVGKKVKGTNHQEINSASGGVR